SPASPRAWSATTTRRSRSRTSPSTGGGRHRRRTMTGIGRYELRGELSRGDFAEVHRAWDRALNREVVVKVLRPSHAADAGTRERFLSSGRLLAALDLPGVVPVYDVGETAEAPYMVMRCVEGATLAERGLGDRRMPLVHVTGIIARLAETVDALHEVMRAHGGITTANVVIERTGQVVLLDPGAAGLLPAPVAHAPTIAGACEAIAPEVAL